VYGAIVVFRTALKVEQLFLIVVVEVVVEVVVVIAVVDVDFFYFKSLYFSIENAIKQNRSQTEENLTKKNWTNRYSEKI